MRPRSRTPAANRAILVGESHLDLPRVGERRSSPTTQASDAASRKESVLARVNYNFEKRQRELAKKKKKEEKLAKKAAARRDPDGEPRDDDGDDDEDKDED